MTADVTVNAYGEGWREVVDRLVSEKIASRIAAKDATVWGPEAESEASVRLSWVDLYESSRPLLAEIEALQADLRAEGLDPDRALRHGRFVAGAGGHHPDGGRRARRTGLDRPERRSAGAGR